MTNSDIGNVPQYADKTSTQNKFEHCLDLYCIGTLDTLPPGLRYFTPHNVASLLHMHDCKKVMYGTKKISIRALILSLIRKKLVPVGQRTLYCILDLFKADKLAPTITWTKLSQ